MNWNLIDTAPKDGRHIQLYRPDIQFVGYYSSVGWIINAPGLPKMNPLPTHWAELSNGPVMSELKQAITILETI